MAPAETCQYPRPQRFAVTLFKCPNLNVHSRFLQGERTGPGACLAVYISYNMQGVVLYYDLRYQ